MKFILAFITIISPTVFHASSSSLIYNSANESERCGWGNLRDYNCRNRNTDLTPLMEAARDGDLKEVEKLLKKVDHANTSTSIKNVKTPLLQVTDKVYGNTALHWAAEGRLIPLDPDMAQNYVRIIELLTDADNPDGVRRENNKGLTPFMSAVKAECPTTMLALLQAESPLVYDKSNKSVFAYQNPKTGDNVFQIAIKNKDFVLLHYLVKIFMGLVQANKLTKEQRSAILNAQNFHGEHAVLSALKLNSASGDTMAALLTLLGINATLEDLYGQSAIEYAEEQRSPELARRLFRYTVANQSGIKNTILNNSAFKSLFTTDASLAEITNAMNQVDTLINNAANTSRTALEGVTTDSSSRKKTTKKPKSSSKQ